MDEEENLEECVECGELPEECECFNNEDEIF